MRKTEIDKGTEKKAQLQIKYKSTTGLFSEASAAMFRLGGSKAMDGLQKTSSRDLSSLLSTDIDWDKKVPTGGSEAQAYYIKQNGASCIWCYSETQSSESSDYEQTVQVGSYSDSASIGFVSYWTASSTVEIPPSTIAHGVGKAIAKGAIKDLGKILGDQIAEDTGIEVGVEIIGDIFGGFIFVLFSLGLSLFTGFLFKRFSLSLQIYNWSKDNDWGITSHHFDNGTIPGETTADKIAIDDIIIPLLPSKGKRPDSIPQDIELGNISVFCSCISFFLQNDRILGGGLGFGLQFSNRWETDGFDYAVMVPNKKKNRQAAKAGDLPARDYYKHIKWNSSPLDFSITSDKGLPITCSMDKLTGGKHNAYKAYVQIDNDKGPVFETINT